jgi:hypothetical protein
VDAMDPVIGLAGLAASAEFEGEVADTIFASAWRLLEVGDRLGQTVNELPDESASHMMTALEALGLSVSAMFAAADIECNLAQPPKAVDTRPRGANKAMVTRCRHNPPHCWDGHGDYITCP